MPTPLPVIPGTYYGAVHGNVLGDPISNVLCFHKPGMVINDSADTANALAVATAVAANWHLALGEVADQYQATEARFYPLGSALVPAQSSFFTAAGGSSGPTTLKQACFVISHTVVRRGRGSQSLTRMGPVKATSIISPGDQFGPTQVAAMQTNWENFLSGALTDLTTAVPGPWSYVQLSKKAGGAIYTIINSLTQSYVGSARERLIRV